MSKKASRKRRTIPPAAKALLELSPPGTVITAPRRHRRTFADPIPSPQPDFTNGPYLEQATLGRWNDPAVSGPDEVEIWMACQTLADFIARRCESYLFPDNATDQGRQRLRDVLAHSYRRGFYLAVLRYRDELKHVPEAASILRSLRRNAAKGGEGRRKKAEPRQKEIRKRFRELRKTTAKKTLRYLRVAEEFGMSDRHVARIVEGID